MESLLKLSGLLNEEDKEDLGTLEKRLADKTNNQSNGSPPSKSPRRSDIISQPRAPSESHRNTPQTEERPSLTASAASAASSATQQDGEEEVEALSEMMCSLVTNNCGETRYIGRSNKFLLLHSCLTRPRIVFRLLNIFSKRHPVG